MSDIEFLREAARYFRKRPTHGEDRAHWANVYNAENCERIAKRLEAVDEKFGSGNPTGSEGFEYSLRVECNCCDETPLDETRLLPNIRAAWDVVITCMKEHESRLAEVIGPEA